MAVKSLTLDLGNDLSPRKVESATKWLVEKLCQRLKVSLGSTQSATMGKCLHLLVSSHISITDLDSN